MTLSYVYKYFFEGPVLADPDPTRLISVVCDASDYLWVLQDDTVAMSVLSPWVSPGIV